MDNLSTNVSQIQADLRSSRALLTTIETGGRRELTTEVSNIRDAVKTGDNKLTQTNCQVRSYLLQIDDVPKAEGTVDMKPQIVWLHKSLDGIVVSLEEAQTAAPCALLCTTECSYRVLDVGREVEKNRETLSQYQQQAQVLAAQASSSLQTSEFLLREALEQISQKEAEIRRKTSEAAAQRARKRQLESEIPGKENQIREVEYRRQGKKESAGLAAVTFEWLVGFIGIAAAPLTGGLSLGATALAAGAAGHKISRADELKAEASALRSQVSGLNRQIAQSAQEATSLEQEKTELEVRIRGYEAEVATRQAMNQEYQEQIAKAIKVDGEINELDSHAHSTAADVNEDNLQLQRWKQMLDDCNELIHAKSLEVGTHASVIERFAGIPGKRAGTKLKRSMEYKRQKKAMEELAQTLDKIHSQVPLLLLSQGEQMKFLDNFSRDHESEENLWIVEVEEMPPVTFHTS